MSELFKVCILSSNFRTCFFYLNKSHLKYNQERAIKIRYGRNRQNISYGCISLTPVSEVPDNCIGITSLFANNLGLKENETLLVSNCDVESIDRLQVFPKNEEDYIILLSCKSVLEKYLLDQVSVVAEGQVLPLYVFSNISIDIEIGKLNLNSSYGQLKKFTELIVLHPSDKVKNLQAEINSKKENTETGEKLKEHMFFELSNLLRNNLSENQSNKLKISELILKNTAKSKLSETKEYKIQPFLFYFCDIPEKIRNKCIIVSGLKNNENVFGPCTVKIFSKVQKVINIKEKFEASDVEDKKEIIFLYTYVISTNNDSNNIALCPPWIMKKLKLFVGSKITVEPVEQNSLTKVELPKQSGRVNYEDEFSDCFWKSLLDIRENIRQVIINNFKYNFKMNSLVLGESGTGKTFLLNSIVNEFTNNFVFCKRIQCKSLRGKKIETLHKLLNDNMRECSYHEPSLFIMDDLHALTYIDEDEGQFIKLYSDRVVDLIFDVLEDFQEKYNISVVASAVSMSQLSGLTSQHGPRLFQNVLIIPQMNFSERNFALKSVMKHKVGAFNDCELDLDNVSNRANGYTIQDLNDLVDRVIFNSLLRNETEINVGQVDFESALLELTPLSLRNMNLKQKINIKWDNVGGMAEPKNILTEVFSWPLNYPKVLESCPLRLQTGVLLYGAPGTGKTLLAGAVANKCGFNFISVKGPEVLSKYVGASEEGVRKLFIQAEKTKPCLLFFDEFDSLAPKRGHDNTGVTDRVVNQLLTQLDGVESLNGVWVLAATSRPDLLDPALLRPGRLDKMVFCDIPNKVDRLSILEVISKDLSKAEDVNLLEIAEKTEGYTGADLVAVLYNAQILAIKGEKNLGEKKLNIKIKQIHLAKALSEVSPSLSVWEKERYRKIYDTFLNSRKRNFVGNYEGTQRVTLA